MRIGIEAQRLFRKKKHGMDIFALELIKALQKLNTPHQFFVFVRPDADDSIIKETPNFKIVRTEGAPYPVWEQIKLRKAIKEYKLDMLHCTANTAPLNCPVPLITTLHDIIYLEKLNLIQGTMYQRIGNLYRRWNVPRSVQQSKIITTVSNFERKRILDHFKLPAEKVVTVYNAVGDHFVKVTDETKLAQVSKKYNLPAKYIFFLGNTDPKKNVRGVITALALLKQKGQLTLPVVIPDLERSYLLHILNEINAASLLDDIVLCGYIPNEEIPAIYSNAVMFLYPSLRESFGIPLLEAMACQVPVITTNSSPMTEVAGDAALFAEPHLPESIAEKIVEMLNSESTRNELIQKGLERVKLFSWEKTAQKMVQLYQTIN
jgi:glycosyltransferase involved in cell wall biosynthesis